jgi:hypothetical protein
LIIAGFSELASQQCCEADQRNLHLAAEFTYLSYFHHSPRQQAENSTRAFISAFNRRQVPGSIAEMDKGYGEFISITNYEFINELWS